jgi:hypothetical protein
VLFRKQRPTLRESCKPLQIRLKAFACSAVDDASVEAEDRVGRAYGE